MILPSTKREKIDSIISSIIIDDKSHNYLSTFKVSVYADTDKEKEKICSICCSYDIIINNVVITLVLIPLDSFYMQILVERNRKSLVYVVIVTDL